MPYQTKVINVKTNLLQLKLTRNISEKRNTERKKMNEYAGGISREVNAAGICHKSKSGPILSGTIKNKTTICL